MEPPIVAVYDLVGLNRTHLMELSGPSPVSKELILSDCEDQGVHPRVLSERSRRTQGELSLGEWGLLNHLHQNLEQLAGRIDS